MGAGTDFLGGNQALVDEPLSAAEHETDTELCAEIAWEEVGHG